MLPHAISPDFNEDRKSDLTNGYTHAFLMNGLTEFEPGARIFNQVDYTALGFPDLDPQSPADPATSPRHSIVTACSK